LTWTSESTALRLGTLLCLCRRSRRLWSGGLGTLVLNGEGQFPLRRSDLRPSAAKGCPWRTGVAQRRAIGAETGPRTERAPYAPAIGLRRGVILVISVAIQPGRKLGGMLRAPAESSQRPQDSTGCQARHFFLVSDLAAPLCGSTQSLARAVPADDWRVGGLGQ